MPYTGSHRAPERPGSAGLRAPLSEWLRDTWTVLVHTFSPTPSPRTLDAAIHIPEADERPPGEH